MATTAAKRRHGPGGARRRGALGLLALVLPGLLLAAAAPRATAGESSASLLVSARIERHLLVEADRQVAALAPGESVVVTVTLKTRVAAGEAVAVVLDAAPAPSAGGAGGARLVYHAGGVTGQLAGSAVVGTVRGSGVHTLPVTLTLPPTAGRPVVVPLSVRAEAGGAPFAVATTRVFP